MSVLKTTLTIALIYNRQSRHKDSERTVSPEVQESACRALPDVQGCDGVEVYVDLDKSGKSIAKRPDFQRFLERIVAGPPAVIAVYDQSRSFRNTTEALDFYALMERMAQVKVVFHLGHFERSPVGEFSYTALAAAHTMERKMTGAKISEAKRYAAGRGEMVGAVPAGYRWKGEGRDRELVIDEELAPIVRRVFSEYATGRYSTRDIARRLNAEGVTLPMFKGGWRADTVAQMLGNPVYAGFTHVSRKRREGELIRGRWKAIIELDTFQAVQLFLQCRRLVHGGRKSEVETRPYVFRGLLRCARCGHRMHAHHMSGHNYFDCRNTDSVKPCRGKLREDRLFPWVERLFEALDAYRPPDLAEAVAERGQQPERRRSPGTLAQIDATLARLGKRFEWGHIDEAAYLAEHARLVQQREEFQGARERPQPTASLPIGSLMDGWRTGDPRTRRGLLAAFFDELDVLDGQVVSAVPRSEYAAEVAALLDSVENLTRCSPGGIRTRDLSLERAAS